MIKKTLIEEFVIKANKKYNNKFDYSLVDYKKNNIKVKIICLKHGVFEQTPLLHLISKYGCKQCSIENRTFTTKKFIDKSIKIHGNKYGYNKVKYINSSTKVKIYCKKCKKYFWQQPQIHYRVAKSRCKSCFIKRKTLTEKEVFKRIKLVHGNEYDLSKIKYNKGRGVIEIICYKHGSFFPQARKFIWGTGCPECANNIKYTTKKWIKKVNKIHNNKYDYSKVIYKNQKTKVEIICKKHGSFFQTAHSHLNKCGCKKCFIEKESIDKRRSTEQFIKEAKKIHGDTYDYSLSDYKSDKLPIKIICKIHGVFKTTPRIHLSGSDCLYCKKKSLGEEKIADLLNNLTISYERQKTFNKCRNPKTNRKLKFDFYLLNLDLLVEYDGEQHFSTKKTLSGGWGGLNAFKDTQYRDNIKNQFCKQNNINLLRIPYTEFNNIENILNEKLIT